MGQGGAGIAVEAGLAVVIQLLLLLRIRRLFEHGEQVVQRRRGLWTQRDLHLQKLVQQLEVARR
ncbi:hypothetical protein D3C78_1960000 [compost metagenome]